MRRERVRRITGDPKTRHSPSGGGGGRRRRRRLKRKRSVVPGFQPYMEAEPMIPPLLSGGVTGGAAGLSETLLSACQSGTLSAARWVGWLDGWWMMRELENLALI